MDRRKFITASGVTVALGAGCLTTDSTDNDPRVRADGDTNDSNGSLEDDSTGESSSDQQLYTVLEDDLTTESPLQHSVEVVKGGLRDPDTPLQVTVTLTNTTNDIITYGERRQALFWNARSDNGFELLPADAADAVYEFDAETSYWVVDDPFVTTTDYQMGELEPGESHSERLLVLVGYQKSPPTDRPEAMAFTTEYRVSDQAEFTDESPSQNGSFKLTYDDDEGEYTAHEAATEFPLRYEAELTQPNIAAPDEPMQLEVSLTNESETPATYGERRTALFWTGRAADFVLYPTDAVSEGAYERDDDTGLWIATEGFAMTMDYQTETLDPGETQTETHLVLHQSTEDGEITTTPPENLSFETSVSLERIDDELVDGSKATWGFTLEAISE